MKANYIVLALFTFFIWMASDAAVRTEAAWKAHDARLAAAIDEATNP